MGSFEAVKQAAFVKQKRSSQSTRHRQERSRANLTHIYAIAHTCELIGTKTSELKSTQVKGAAAAAAAAGCTRR